MVRTLTYVFLFDAALTIFHNSPPRMVVSELRMDMACPEACFQAESAEECLFELRKWSSSVFWCERLSVASVVRRMCQPQPQAQISEEQEPVLGFSQMGSLNLFTTVQCTSHFFSLPPSQPPITNNNRPPLPNLLPPKLPHSPPLPPNPPPDRSRELAPHMEQTSTRRFAYPASSRHIMETDWVCEVRAGVLAVGADFGYKVGLLCWVFGWR
jgi:hypothetical protein